MRVAPVIPINCDLGESFGLWRMGDDAGLMPWIQLANVACGFHASDFEHMHSTVRLAKRQGVKVGAHPSLPDRQGFGRRVMAMRRDELADCVLYQVGALTAFLRAEGMELHHIKPHGALYGMAARDPEMAHAIADAAAVFGVPVLGMAGTEHERIYPARGLRLVREFYADLDYDEAGRLVIAREHDAVDPAEAAARVVRAVEEGVVRSTAGTDVPVVVETVCVHSDTPNAVAIAKAVHDALAELAGRPRN